MTRTLEVSILREDIQSVPYVFSGQSEMKICLLRLNLAHTTFTPPINLLDQFTLHS